MGAIGMIFGKGVVGITNEILARKYLCFFVNSHPRPHTSIKFGRPCHKPYDSVGNSKVFANIWLTKRNFYSTYVLPLDAVVSVKALKGFILKSLMHLLICSFQISCSFRSDLITYFKFWKKYIKIQFLSAMENHGENIF